MVLKLAATLEVPHREQNQLLVAAGFAPMFSERSMDEPEMRSARAAIDRILAAYEPYPCLVVDRGWNIRRQNSAIELLLDGVSPHLLEKPNALRISLHPDGLAPRIRNLSEWRHHVLGRLDREAAASGSASLRALAAELDAYPGGRSPGLDSSRVSVTLDVETDAGVLSFISMVTTFGTALDVTAAELSIEAFFPADAATASVLTAQATAR